jgi:monofunctional glycosyltransferase
LNSKEKNRSNFKCLVYLFFIVAMIISAIPMLLLRYFDPPTSSFIIQNEHASKRQASYQWLPLENISESLQLAAMASEDQKFPFHHGIDLIQIRNALMANESRERPLGASTITQQTVKNLFLWSKQTFLRKGIEAWLAIWMELILPKYRILEIYLNVAQWGPTHYGALVASSRYFNINAANLDDRQAALLVAALPTPSRSNPGHPTEYLESRAEALLDDIERLRKQGYIVGLYL